MRVLSLASGSKGNAYVVESEGAILLIDCALSCRQLKERLAAFGFDAGAIAGVVFTHEHEDHVKGVPVFAKKHPGVPLFANALTAEAAHLPDPYLFENCQPFEVGPFEVTAFSVPHDVSDPVGFVVKAGARTYFHATDFGTPLDSIGARLREADVATLEANHDPGLLMQSGRPPLLKRRILGASGHLSNDQCADLVRRFASPKLKHLSLAHLSGECNAPHLASAAVGEALREIGRGDVDLAVLEQDSAGGYWEC